MAVKEVDICAAEAAQRICYLQGNDHVKPQQAATEIGSISLQIYLQGHLRTANSLGAVHLSTQDQ